MGVKINFNFKKEKHFHIKRMINNQNKFGKVLHKLIGTKTPEDTKDLIKNNILIPAVLIGNKIISSIENKTEYAYDVEYGKNQVFNYHKNKQVFYTGVGAGMFYKSAFELEGEFVNFIKK